VKFGIGSALGTGDQTMCWIHADDLSRLFAHAIEFQLDGAYNAIAGTCSNLEFTKNLAKVLQKPFWFPAVPAFMMQLLFGEMSIILLKGLRASNEKIKSTGFEFLYTDVKAALKTVV
jgi:NAD dependent epimerase/dehydratase family enzyme